MEDWEGKLDNTIICYRMFSQVGKMHLKLFYLSVVVIRFNINKNLDKLRTSVNVWEYIDFRCLKSVKKSKLLFMQVGFPLILKVQKHI